MVFKKKVKIFIHRCFYAYNVITFWEKEFNSSFLTYVNEIQEFLSDLCIIKL